MTWPIDVLAYAAGPAALFVAGAALTQFRIGHRLRESLLLAALKIVALPALVWVLAAHVFALTPMEIAVATIAAGLPTGEQCSSSWRSAIAFTKMSAPRPRSYRRRPRH